MTKSTKEFIAGVLTLIACLIALVLVVTLATAFIIWVWSWVLTRMVITGIIAIGALSILVYKIQSTETKE